MAAKFDGAILNLAAILPQSLASGPGEKRLHVSITKQASWTCQSNNSSGCCKRADNISQPIYQIPASQPTSQPTT